MLPVPKNGGLVGQSLFNLIMVIVVRSLPRNMTTETYQFQLFAGLTVRNDGKWQQNDQ
jgi:hypothetical protein